MVIVCLLWALGTVVGKGLIGDGPGVFRPTVFNELRFLIATPALFLMLAASGSPLTIRREHVPGMLFVSIGGMFFFMVLFITGLSLTSAANTGIIMGAIPLVILVVSVARGVDRPSFRLAAGILMGMAGVLVMNWQNGAPAFNRGDLLILASGLCWAVYAVWGERFLKVYQPLLATAWIFLFLTIAYLPLFLWEVPRQEWGSITAAGWLGLVFSALGPLLAANSLYYVAIGRIGPARSGIYINLEPVFTVMLAALFLGEHIAVRQIAGLAVVLMGVAMARLPERNTEPGPVQPGSGQQ